MAILPNFDDGQNEQNKKTVCRQKFTTTVKGVKTAWEISINYYAQCAFLLNSLLTRLSRRNFF